MKRSLLLALLLIFSISCSEDEEPYADYEGNWSGSYSGADTGSWSVVVNEKGKVSGTATSDSLPEFPFSFSGTVSTSGNFNAQVPLFQDTIVYTGQLKGKSASGTWSGQDSSFVGTWQGTKD